MAYPPLKLSRLREIGWSGMDPIGILSEGEKWEHHPAASEYDGYLLQVAGGLRKGGTIAGATEYLLRIQRESLGLSVTWIGRARARNENKGDRSQYNSLRERKLLARPVVAFKLARLHQLDSIFAIFAGGDHGNPLYLRLFGLLCGVKLRTGMR